MGTRKMLNEAGEEVVYIEYCNGIPHSVLTAPVGGDGLSVFDFEYIGKDKTDIQYYESGGGGSKKSIQAPHFCSPKGKRYWMHEEASFKKGTKAINSKRIDKPLQLRGWSGKSLNPFKVSNENSYGFDWCDLCKCHYSHEDACREHMSWSDEQGCFIYDHDGSRVE